MEKVIYICDGCKKEIKPKPIEVYRQDDTIGYKQREKPYTTSKGIHLCNQCLGILRNLVQAGCEIEF